MVSPYWSDIDTRSSGEILYEVHTNATSLGMLNMVSKYIRQEERNRFAGTWMVVAKWNEVPLPGETGRVMYL